MKILAIDTACERCSTALLIDERCIERSSEMPRGHAEHVLPMVAEVLAEANVELRDLDAIAYGRGPGAFTGVRIAVGVAQGLAFGAQRLTVGVSNLAAVARQVAQPGDEVLVCMDARMGEVYWARFVRRPGSPVVEPLSEERVSAPTAVDLRPAVFAGTGFRAYPEQLPGAGAIRLYAEALPRAQDIARLAVHELHAGRGAPASHAAPVYLRDEVAKKMAER